MNESVAALICSAGHKNKLIFSFITCIFVVENQVEGKKMEKVEGKMFSAV